MSMIPPGQSRGLSDIERETADRMNNLILELKDAYDSLSAFDVEELSERHKLLPSTVIQTARSLGIHPGKGKVKSRRR